MTVKKKYNVGDTVWIYGVTNGKTTEGKIVHWFTIKEEGWDNDKRHYVIAIPTEIEYLLEVRTWETISQSKDGHVGSLREAFENPDAAIRQLRRTGVDLISSGDFESVDSESEDDDDGISDDAIHAALDSSLKNSTHQPLVLKSPKPRRRYPTRKKKTNE